MIEKCHTHTVKCRLPWDYSHENIGHGIQIYQRDLREADLCNFLIAAYQRQNSEGHHQKRVAGRGGGGECGGCGQVVWEGKGQGHEGRGEGSGEGAGGRRRRVGDDVGWRHPLRGTELENDVQTG